MQSLDIFLPITPQLAAEVESAVAFIQAHTLRQTILHLLERTDTVHWADHVIRGDDTETFQRFQAYLSWNNLKQCRQQGADTDASHVSKEFVDFGIGILLLANDHLRTSTLKECDKPNQFYETTTLSGKCVKIISQHLSKRIVSQIDLRFIKRWFKNNLPSHVDELWFPAHIASGIEPTKVGRGNHYVMGKASHNGKRLINCDSSLHSHGN